MLLADVNVIVAAHRPDHPAHDGCLVWLAAALDGAEPFGVSELVLSGFVRVVTNRRVFRQPETPAKAFAFCDRVLTAPASRVLRPGAGHFAIFSRLCREVGARANVVPDAYHAALAIEHGATWVTADRGFARFPGLKWTPAPS